MLKITRHILATASVVALAAGTTVSAGLTSASASTTRGTEHFQLVSTSTTSSKSSIIADGKFTAAGVNYSGKRVDTAVFPGGRFKIVHSRGRGRQSFNKGTCVLRVHRHGTYLLRSGTGRFKHIRGHGRYELDILAVFPRGPKGNCTQHKAPRAWHQIIHARGPVRGVK
ncbi:MAG TPA: hypothetical protein VG253_25495 [Streptosporangiaceae bacterium]|nr:hypothetical protein [Streptosporangiaceae bacterium]